MEEGKLGRRERRRRKMEGNQPEEYEFEKTLENSELPIKSHVTHSLGKLTRRDTYTVLHSKSDFDVASADGDVEEDFHVKSEGSGNNSTESRNLTYSLNKGSDTSNHCTYNIDKPPAAVAQHWNEVDGWKLYHLKEHERQYEHAKAQLPDLEIRPVPAPRRRKSIHVEAEKLSSDTDRDITEIDLDDPRIKSPKSETSPISSKSSEPIFDSRRPDSTAPVPKPRKSLQTPTSENSKKSDSPTKISDNLKMSSELPLVSDLQEETKSDEVQKPKKQKKLIGDLLDRKGKKKKSKTFSSLIKLERKKMPKISSILKDLKEDEGKPDVEEDKTDFQIDSPRYKESAQNGQIYVQGKNGFHMMKRDEVLRSGNDGSETDGNGGGMEDSNVTTAVLFQKFWSRSMTYLHGVLAGIGFSHAATVTAIMLHYNYDPQGFISVYSCLSLKIHYVFYALIALCIVSSFDRVDIGHMNRRHWENALKSPSTWVVLSFYLISFALTFANQRSEARFDALPGANETEIWDAQSPSEIQVSLLQWYHAVWARDILVLLAWLLIALTKFEDSLHSHINNMAKYANIQEEQCHRHKTDYF